MMNYKIICDNKEIEFTNNYPALAFSDDEHKNFYRVKDNIIEVNYLSFNEIDEERDFSRRFKTIFVILKSIEDCSFEKLEDILAHDNVIVGVRSNSAHINNKRIITFKDINERINVEALIDMFSNEDILSKVKNKNNISSMILGYESLTNPVGNILNNVLKNFKYIDNYKDYIMYLYSNKEFNLQETAYLEDLLKEYSYGTGKIEINQINDDGIKDNVFYSILATR